MEWFEQWFDEDYARLYAHRDEAEARRGVAMALEAAPELRSGPVLDLACGGGRHLSAMVDAGLEAFGLDLSAALLAQAPASARGRLVRGDMRALPFRDGAFAGICLWFTPFGYFGDGENEALLRRLSDFLKPGGVLLLDYLNALRLAQDLVPMDVQERAGLRVESRRALEGHRVVKEMTLTRLDTGEVRHARESVRVYEPAALEAMARDAGLHLRRAFGGYDGMPFEATSPRWIALFQKRPAQVCPPQAPSLRPQASM